MCQHGATVFENSLHIQLIYGTSTNILRTLRTSDIVQVALILPPYPILSHGFFSTFPQNTNDHSPKLENPSILFQKPNTRVPSCTQQEENPPLTGVCWHVARPLWESETTNDQIWGARVWLGATQVTPRVSHGTKFLVSKFFSYYPHMKSIYRNF